MKTFIWLYVLGLISLAVIGLAIGLGSAVLGETAQDNMMAEMQKCTVCKYMAEKPELMKNMAWETHKLENGMLWLTTVPKELKAEFDAVGEKMMAAIEKVKADAEQGKEVELCSHCESMGELMKQGVKEQNLKTSSGAIHLFTSDDPAVVAKIHALADKAIAEQKKMAEHHTASVQ